MVVEAMVVAMEVEAMVVVGLEGGMEVEARVVLLVVLMAAQLPLEERNHTDDSMRYVLHINNDVTGYEPGWLEALVRRAELRPETWVILPLLLEQSHERHDGLGLHVAWKKVVVVRPNEGHEAQQQQVEEEEGQKEEKVCQKDGGTQHSGSTGSPGRRPVDRLVAVFDESMVHLPTESLVAPAMRSMLERQDILIMEDHALLARSSCFSSSSVASPLPPPSSPPSKVYHDRISEPSPRAAQSAPPPPPPPPPPPRNHYLFDPATYHRREFLDLLWGIRARGGDVTVCTESVVRYEKEQPLRLADVPYFAVRRTDEISFKSQCYLDAKWNIAFRKDRWHELKRDEIFGGCRFGPAQLWTGDEEAGKRCEQSAVLILSFLMVVGFNRFQWTAETVADEQEEEQEEEEEKEKEKEVPPEFDGLESLCSVRERVSEALQAAARLRPRLAVRARQECVPQDGFMFGPSLVPGGGGLWEADIVPRTSDLAVLALDKLQEQSPYSSFGLARITCWRQGGVSCGESSSSSSSSSSSDSDSGGGNPSLSWMADLPLMRLVPQASVVIAWVADGDNGSDNASGLSAAPGSGTDCRSSSAVVVQHEAWVWLRDFPNWPLAHRTMAVEGLKKVAKQAADEDGCESSLSIAESGGDRTNGCVEISLTACRGIEGESGGGERRAAPRGNAYVCLWRYDPCAFKDLAM